MITRNLELRTGDLEPDLVLDIIARDPLTNIRGPVDFTLATAVRVIGRKNGATFIDRPGIGDPNGVVQMSWITADTLTPGTITFEVEAMWPGNRPQTFRADNKVVIYPDLA
jgi:hypothetical protein